MPTSPATLAAFDVDLTLTRRDCVLPFMRVVAGDVRVGLALVRNAPLLLATALGRRSRDDAKAALVAAVFSRRSAQVVADRGERFAQDTFDKWLRPDTLTRLRWHQGQGHTVVLVSASLGPYLHPLGRLLGVDHVLCTELKQSVGKLTGELAGRNCRGSEKREQLVAHYGERPEHVWAYGDSDGDREMLAWADKGILLGRDDVLSAVPEGW
jgi:phosphatidylglycerophosphatase C